MLYRWKQDLARELRLPIDNYTVQNEIATRDKEAQSQYFPTLQLLGFITKLDFAQWRTVHWFLSEIQLEKSKDNLLVATSASSKTKDYFKLLDSNDLQQIQDVKSNHQKMDAIILLAHTNVLISKEEAVPDEVKNVVKKVLKRLDDWCYPVFAAELAYPNLVLQSVVSGQNFSEAVKIIFLQNTQRIMANQQTALFVAFLQNIEQRVESHKQQLTWGQVKDEILAQLTQLSQPSDALIVPENSQERNQAIEEMVQTRLPRKSDNDCRVMAQILSTMSDYVRVDAHDLVSAVSEQLGEKISEVPKLKKLLYFLNTLTSQWSMRDEQYCALPLTWEELCPVLVSELSRRNQPQP